MPTASFNTKSCDATPIHAARVFLLHNTAQRTGVAKATSKKKRTNSMPTLFISSCRIDMILEARYMYEVEMTLVRWCKHTEEKIEENLSKPEDTKDSKYTITMRIRKSEQTAHGNSTMNAIASTITEKRMTSTSTANDNTPFLYMKTFCTQEAGTLSTRVYALLTRTRSANKMHENRKWKKMYDL